MVYISHGGGLKLLNKKIRPPKLGTPLADNGDPWSGALEKTGEPTTF
jgi:hypothetical protein